MDPFAPLRTITIGDVSVAICQRVSGPLYVQYPNGAHQPFPVGFSVDQVEQAVRDQFAAGCASALSQLADEESHA